MFYRRSTKKRIKTGDYYYYFIPHTTWREDRFLAAAGREGAGNVGRGGEE
jgi:hypothetical protein